MKANQLETRLAGAAAAQAQPARKTFTLPGDLTALAAATEALDRFWQEQRVDENVQADLNIAIEEIASNAIRHGSQPLDPTGEDPILIRVTVGPDDIRIEIEDAGVAFNPLAHPLPDPATPLDERRAGGLGILMVVQMMDQVSYVRSDGRNCLTLVRSRTRV